MTWNITYWSQDTINNGFWWCDQWHHYIPWVKTIEMRWNMTFLVMWCHLHQYHMILLPLSVAHDTDANTSTSTGTKSHLIPPRNHLNMVNARVLLMAPSASFGRKHVTVIFVPWHDFWSYDANGFTWLLAGNSPNLGVSHYPTQGQCL